MFWFIILKKLRCSPILCIRATFFSGDVKEFDVTTLFDKHPEYKILQKDEVLFNNATLLPQGSGVYFNDDLDLTVEEIYKYGKTINKVPVDVKYSIAYAIASTREAKKLSQSQLSKLSGVTQCDISRIEGATANPTLETLQKICKVLGLEVKLTDCV